VDTSIAWTNASVVLWPISLECIAVKANFAIAPSIRHRRPGSSAADDDCDS
jgi:hypothetical protein